MLEDYLIRHGAPTLAGIKTGNMFTMPVSDRVEVRSELRDMNRVLRDKGLRVIPLRYSQQRVLLYVYRPQTLMRDLQGGKARHLLLQSGFCCDSCTKCILSLISRLRDGGDFPHEVGLFLGYPPEDVEGFIVNHAENCKFCGVWKVYGDVDLAKRRFQKFRACTESYERHRRNGMHVENLAVAIQRDGKEVTI